MSIDYRTSVLASAMGFFVLAAMMTVMSLRSAKAFPGERSWAAGYVFFFLGSMAAGLRGVLPLSLSVFGGNAFLLVGLVAIVSGGERFFGAKPALAAYVALVVLEVALAMVMASLVQDARMRVIALDFASVAILGISAARVLRRKAKASARGSGFLAGAYSLVIVLLVLRTVNAGSIDAADLLASGSGDSFLILGLAASFLVLAFLLRQLVSSRLRAELDEALADRELLLREMHHRLKNDLQLVQSLLSLDMGEAEPTPGLRERLELLDRRIHSIGLVHEMLHRLGAVRDVRLDEYLALLAETFSIAETRCAVDTALEPVSLDSKRAISVGIVVNELAANALRHAFPGGRPGRLLISLSSREGRVVVAVADDGVGYDPGEREAGFGSALVSALSEQLHGELSWESVSGTRAVLSFPAVEPGPAG